MTCMFVTREVSQLSGWLKADANCRGSQAGHTRCAGRAAGREARGGGRARCTQRVPGREGATPGWGAGGEQLTRNMECMFVTREVFQPEMSALKLCLE